MKKLSYLLFIVSSFFLVSCEDEEGTNPLVVGEWDLSALDYTYTTTSTAFGITISLTGTGTGFDMNSSINFTSDPNEFNTSGTYSVELTYDTDTQSFTQNVENVPFDVNGTWELDGDNVILTVDGESTVMNVISVAENEIVLGYRETDTYTENGATVEAEIDAEFTFTR